MRRLALLLEYDGRLYAGSQWQLNGPSIQQEVEQAIEAMTGTWTRLSLAGRTDAGVHALGQVAAFDTASPYDAVAFVGGMNVRLPVSIAVQACAEVDGSFDPRRRAVARRYRYTIVNTNARAPLWDGRAWQVRRGLDEQLMQAAATALTGEHDFAAFAAPEAARMSTRREVRQVSIRRQGRTVTVEIEANAFLMHQVRRTVAALVEVGCGRRPLSEFTRGLAEARPGYFEQAAPPYGLCLLNVRYDPPIFGQEWNHEDLQHAPC